MVGNARKAGSLALLIAMAIQGVTPDDLDLASGRIIRLVQAGWAGPRPGREGTAPSGLTISGDRGHSAPRENGPTISPGVASPVRVADRVRTILHALPARTFLGTTRSDPGTPRPCAAVAPWADGLIVPPCRLNC